MWRATRKVAIYHAVPKASCVEAGACRLCTQPTQQQQPPSEKQAPPPSPPPPPPPPPPHSSSGGSGRGIFWKLLGVTLVGAGVGTVGYAWYDKEFRKLIESNVPYSKPVLHTIFLYIPGLGDPLDVPLTEPWKGPITKEIEGTKAPKQVIKPAIPVPETKPKEVKPKDNVSAAEQKKKAQQERVKTALLEKEAEEAAENAALESILDTFLEETAQIVTRAINAHRAAAQNTRTHSRHLKEAMDNDVSTSDVNAWEFLPGTYEMKRDSIHLATTVNLTAEEKIEQLKQAIKDAKENQATKKNTSIMEAEKKLNQMIYDLKTAYADYTKAESESKVMQQYKDLIKKGKEQFKKELESIVPEVKIGRHWGKMTEDELNSLIAHAHRRIEQLQKQLAEQQALEKLRMQQSLDKKQQEDEKLADNRIVLEKEKLLTEFEIERQKLALEAAVKFEQDLRHQLARQAAAHSDHLAEVLNVMEKEMYAKYEVLLEENILKEKQKFRGELASHVQRMRGIEAALEGRAEMEKQGRKAQELWLACQTLYNILLNGEKEDETGEKQLKPLATELQAIKDAGNDHPFVNTVIASFPKDAAEKGVWTQDALVERYNKVRTICKRVAMIDETGGTLFQYFLSYLQSFLVFSKGQPFNNNDEIDLDKLCTFTILQQATHCMERGDLEQALRYMNQLQGEARKVAADWINDARLLLEARQAADALLGHASACALGALF